MPETMPEPGPVPEPTTESVPGTDRRTGGLPAVLAVTAGVFAIVTTEILPVGLLGPIGATFRISDGTTGLMMTLPGLVAAVAAPVVTVATRRADRRTMLCALLLLLALADLLNAVAPAYSAVLLARVALGLVIGAFWSIGSGLAPRLVPPERQARANTVIFTAVPLGSVLGVPAGVLLGSLAGWRAAFAAMAVLTLLALAALLATLPALPPPATTTGLGVLRGLLTGRGILAGLAVTFLIVLAHFGAYTYVTPSSPRSPGSAPARSAHCCSPTEPPDCSATSSAAPARPAPCGPPSPRPPSCSRLPRCCCRCSAPTGRAPPPCC